MSNIEMTIAAKQNGNVLCASTEKCSVNNKFFKWKTKDNTKTEKKWKVACKKKKWPFVICIVKWEDNTESSIFSLKYLVS